MATILIIKDTIKRSGSRKNLNLDIFDSRNPIIKQKIIIFIIKTIIPILKASKLTLCAMPKGKKIFAHKLVKIINLLAPAHSIKANFLPEYSNIMAS